MSHRLRSFRKEPPEIARGNPAHGVVRVRVKKTRISDKLMRDNWLRFVAWVELKSLFTPSDLRGKDSLGSSGVNATHGAPL